MRHLKNRVLPIALALFALLYVLAQIGPKTFQIGGSGTALSLSAAPAEGNPARRSTAAEIDQDFQEKYAAALTVLAQIADSPEPSRALIDKLGALTSSVSEEPVNLEPIIVIPQGTRIINSKSNARPAKIPVPATPTIKQEMNYGPR